MSDYRAAASRTDIGAGLPGVALCLALLLSRIFAERPGGGTVPALAAVYLIVFFVCRGAASEWSPRLGSVAVGVGVAAVLAQRVVLPPVASGRATVVGVVLALAAAVAEESLFRGALYGFLERAGAATAIVASALLFALVHVPFYGIASFPLDLGAGLLFGWQRWVSRGWAAPAATHAFANVVGMLG